MYRYIHEYEIALFWWAFRVAFYYLLTREVIFYLLPAFLKSCKAYVESFFPPSLVDAVEAVAEECVNNVLDTAMEQMTETVDELEAACTKKATPVVGTATAAQ